MRGEGKGGVRRFRADVFVQALIESHARLPVSNTHLWESFGLLSPPKSLISRNEHLINEHARS